MVEAMSESKSMSKSESIPETEETSEPEATTKAAPEKNSSSFLASILSILAIIMVVAMGYFYYQDRSRLYDDYQQMISGQQNTVSQQKELSQQIQVQIRTIQETLTERESAQQAAITGLTDQLVASNERLSELSGNNQRSWYLDEAYYLLRMANNRIIFLQDLKTALILIDQADALLAKVDDVELFSVRQKLAEDRQRLIAVAPVDQTGTAIRLGAIQGRVDNLPLQKFLYQAQEKEAEPEPEATTWYEHLGNSMSKLGEQWFQVRKHSPGYNPLMTESEAQQLRYVVLLTVQTAQFAVLHQDGDLYQASLLQLRSRINNYFDIEDPEVQTVLKEVAMLLEIPVIQESVAGLHTLSLLQSFLQEQRSAQIESDS